MILITIQTKQWCARAWCSDDVGPGAYHHFQVQVDGVTEPDCRAGGDWVLNFFAQGRDTFIRTPVEMASDTDFDSKVTRHRGFVRFSVRLQAGEWHYPEPAEENTSIGFAHG